MDDGVFWDLIDRARGVSGSAPEVPSADPDRLRLVLEAESDEVVGAFGLRFYAEIARLNHWNLWAAGDVIAGGMSQDCFHYFRSWLVGKGKAAVGQALADPDGLGMYVDDPEEVDNESLEYVAVEILEARGGEDPRNDFDEELGPDDAPLGTPYEEEELPSRFPRLTARFGGG